MIKPNEAFQRYLAYWRDLPEIEKIQCTFARPKILTTELHCCGMAVLTNLQVDRLSDNMLKGIVCDEISKYLLEPPRSLGIYPYRNLFYFAGAAYGQMFEFLTEIGFVKTNTFKNFAHDNAPLYMYALLNE